MHHRLSRDDSDPRDIYMPLLLRTDVCDVVATTAFAWYAAASFMNRNNFVLCREVESLLFASRLFHGITLNNGIRLGGRFEV